MCIHAIFSHFVSDDHPVLFLAGKMPELNLPRLNYHLQTEIAAIRDEMSILSSTVDKQHAANNRGMSKA